ncbi:MAG: DUF1553 domain-containing protein [Acidobacteria bacterium]|nr:DUF1553 domain-containing protein [Acidobacteriota bacterium]
MLRSLCALGLLAALAASAQEVRFNRDVRPILSDKCFACHGPDAGNRSTPLRFDSREGAFVDLLSGGKAIVPGDPAQSKLIERVSSEDPVRRMPPSYKGHAKLSEREIATLTRWIEQGAEWEGHWAFQRVERPTVPPNGEGWARDPIDRFVARRLDREDMRPTKEADRATWARRATLDLTGLPPTPAEVDAFVADESADAYEKVVDRLLASPRYGERMAFRWLEAARYADTNGYQNDQERDMWRWRDWVIEAYNKNLPFDEFTVWQIAGDLLPNATLEQRIASGFNRNHRGNGEAGIVPEEYHVEYVVDRVEATSMVWMGLTMGCARCHDHKYDPLTQKEFYQLFAYFNQVPDRGRYFKYGNTPPFVQAPTAEQAEKLAALDARIEKTEATLQGLEGDVARGLQAWQPVQPWSFDESLLFATFGEGPRKFEGKDFADLGEEGGYSFYDRLSIGVRVRPDEIQTAGLVAKSSAKGDLFGGKGWGFYLDEGRPRFRMGNGLDDSTDVRAVKPLPVGAWSHLTFTYDGSRLTRGMKIYVDGRPVELEVVEDHSNNEITLPKTPLRAGVGPEMTDLFRGELEDLRLYDRDLSADEAAVLAVEEGTPALAALAAAERSEAAGRKLRWAYLSDEASGPAGEAWRELRRLRLARQEMTDGFPTVMVMSDAAGRQTHLLKRGAYDAPGEAVEPGVPAVLPPLPAGGPNNRLGLAEWLVSRDNPLTARVTVNRFWQMLFGQGIVETVEDFGSQGSWPTHPELLDWLAAEFMESGWDTKALLKRIVLSATYRQGSQLTPDKLEKDPQNKLLSRGPRVRLPAEAVRDQALAVAGLLSERVGGPSVKPYQPAGLWTELSNWEEYEHDKGGDLYRRSLYTFWKRTIAPPSMVAFDAAPRETCVVRETRTNTPLQALGLMNDVTYVEAARKLGERMLTEGGSDAEARLDYGFRLATAREPGQAELAVLKRGLQRYQQRYAVHPADAEKLLSQGDSPRSEAIEPAEQAAYAAVASLILNLDEAITKE